MGTEAIIRDRPVNFTKDQVLGTGGEAMIFKDPDFPNEKAVKVYHDTDAFRGKKLEAFFRGNFKLPANVIAPLEPVHNRQREIIGFVMRQLNSRYSKFNQIFKKSFCLDNGITAKAKVEIFLNMLADLANIHAQGMVIGDFNDNNQMIHDRKRELAWIDVDSWQFGNFPCISGTQSYLHPSLYGIDLAAAGKPLFKPEHDWFSYAIMLIRSLLNGVHPFRSGDHPKWKSVTNRAENGATVFDSDVSYPDIGLPPEVLTDELLHAAIEILKRQTSAPFPEEKLREFGEVLVECKSCGLWYPGTRSHCPGCSKRTSLDMQMAAKVANLLVEKLIVTPGRIVEFKQAGSGVMALAEEAGELAFYKQFGNKPANRIEICKDIAGARYLLFGEQLVICPDPTQEVSDLYVLDVSGTAPSPVATTNTVSMAGGRAVFDCSDRYLYRIADRMLLCCQRFGSHDLLERPVTQVFRGQTWFRAATDPGTLEELIFGFDRIFKECKWFLARGNHEGKEFNRFEVAIPQLDKGESLTDLEIYFSSGSILLCRKTRRRGVDWIRLERVETHDGKVNLSKLVKISDNPCWETLSGKAMNFGLVMHPTSKGVIKESLDNQATAGLFGTEQYVTADDRLFPSHNGILVVKDDCVVLLQPKK